MFSSPLPSAIESCSQAMFSGEYPVTLDDKGRMTLPTCLREQVAEVCGGDLSVTYSPYDRGALYILPRPLWDKVSEQIKALPGARRSSREMMRKIVGSVSHQTLDGNARITVPPSHRQTVGIDRRAVLIGMGDKFELWSVEAHAAQMSQTLSDEDLDSEELLGLSL